MPPLPPPAFHAALPLRARRAHPALAPRRSLAGRTAASASASASASPTPARHSAAPPHTAPILRPSPPQAWDSGAVSSPSVAAYASSDGGVAYAMWYSARAAAWPGAAACPPGTLCGHVGLALSEDGLSFTRVAGPHDGGAVLAPNRDDWWWFDTRYVDVGCVVLGGSELVRADEGVFFMYYSGGDARVGDFPTAQGEHVKVPGMRRCIGLALSKDGEHFTRIEGDFPSGAILEPGAPGAFDALFVAAPDVVRPSRPVSKRTRFVMHYYTYDAHVQQFVIGRAHSADGILFTKDSTLPALSSRGEPFAGRGVSRCSVVERPSGDFAMFVECVGDDSVHRIAVCESDDCETWGPLTLVLEPSEQSAWDCAGVSHPCATVLEDGSVRLYYVGKGADHDVDKGRGTCIGVAQSDGEDWTSLRRASQAAEAG